MPLFVLAGAILPMMPRATRIPEGLVEPLEIDLYPEGPSAFTLLEEGGRTEFRLEPAKKGYALEWSGPFPRTLVIRAGRAVVGRSDRAKGRIRFLQSSED
jgi:hypothetical protein